MSAGTKRRLLETMNAAPGLLLRKDVCSHGLENYHGLAESSWQELERALHEKPDI